MEFHRPLDGDWILQRWWLDYRICDPIVGLERLAGYAGHHHQIYRLRNLLRAHGSPRSKVAHCMASVDETDMGRPRLFCTHGLAGVLVFRLDGHEHMVRRPMSEGFLNLPLAIFRWSRYTASWWHDAS